MPASWVEHLGIDTATGLLEYSMMKRIDDVYIFIKPGTKDTCKITVLRGDKLMTDLDVEADGEEVLARYVWVSYDTDSEETIKEEETGAKPKTLLIAISRESTDQYSIDTYKVHPYSEQRVTEAIELSNKAIADILVSG